MQRTDQARRSRPKLPSSGPRLIPARRAAPYAERADQARHVRRPAGSGRSILHPAAQAAQAAELKAIVIRRWGAVSDVSYLHVVGRNSIRAAARGPGFVSPVSLTLPTQLDESRPRVMMTLSYAVEK